MRDSKGTLDSMDIAEIRERHWRPLAARHRPAAWNALDDAYGAPGRAYHSWSHIGDLLAALEEFSSLATRRDLVATAIFWHDSVYTTRDEARNRRADLVNVQDSADMFRRHALMPGPDLDAVEELILATANHLDAAPGGERYPGFSGDLDLFLDLDLSPLAVSWDHFAANFQAIRHEFDWVPEPIFNAGQGAFLASLLADRDRLFRRPETIRKWRRKALSNIARCLDTLDAGGGLDRCATASPRPPS